MSKLRYDEIFNSRRILKWRRHDQCDDPESISFVSESDLIEVITRIGFGLDQVQGWEEYIDPLEKFKNKDSKIVVTIYGVDEVILLEDYDYFNAVMLQFISTQQKYDIKERT